jgi:hypothetical protein
MTENTNPEVTVRNSRVYVSRSINKEPETGEEEVLAVHRFVTEPAEVEVAMALTMNLGSYETARLSVSLRVPCYKEEIDTAYKFAETWVAEKIERERDQISATRRGSANPF